jgi:hypothetical protein
MRGMRIGMHYHPWARTYMFASTSGYPISGVWQRGWLESYA